MPQYVQESLGTIRRRFGNLVFRDKYLQDTVLSATVNAVTLNKAKPLPGGRLTGASLNVLDGDAIGAITNVTGSTQGTGAIAVLPAFGTAPSVGSTVEVWPKGVTADLVNEYINMAILGAADISSVLARSTPTIASDRLSVTIPATYIKVARLTWLLSTGERVVLRPWDALDAIRQDNTFVLDETTLRLHNAIPSDATSVQVVGYRQPAFLDADADLAEMRSDYIIYKAAALLAASDAEGPALDPEAHGSQALTWQREADRLRPGMLTQHLSNTQSVDTLI